MANTNIEINEEKIKHENVFSLPIVQYQTTNTDKLNKELKEIILKKENELPTTNKSNQGGWQSEGDFFRWGGESVETIYNLFSKLIEIEFEIRFLPKQAKSFVSNEVPCCNCPWLYP